MFHILAQLPCGEPIQRVVIVSEGKNPEHAISQAVNDVTVILNRRAAEKISQGHTLDKEIVIEITRIASPETGQSAKNREPSKVASCHQNHHQSSSSSSSSVNHQPQKNPMLKRYNSAPSPATNKQTVNNQYYSSSLPYELRNSTTSAYSDIGATGKEI